MVNDRAKSDASASSLNSLSSLLLPESIVNNNTVAMPSIPSSFVLTPVMKRLSDSYLKWYF